MNPFEYLADLVASRLRLMAVAALFGMPVWAYGQVNEAMCGSLSNGYGPFDYRTERGKLKVVESFHFTPEIENLVRGKTSSVGGDLDYTLRASPNHHRALVAMMRYGEKLRSPQPSGAQHSIECYLERAVRFRNDDVVARMIYASYLVAAKRTQEAAEQLQRTSTLAGDNGFTHFNIGLIYLDMKNYEAALDHAHKASALGFAQTTLKERLEAAGKWSDPVARPAAAPENAARNGSATDPK